MKKIVKFIASRLTYLLIGLSFSIVVIFVNAAVISTPVPTGALTPLTADRWNQMVSDLNSIQTEVTNIDTTVTSLDAAISGSLIKICIQCSNRVGIDLRTNAMCTTGGWGTFTTATGWNNHDGRCRVCMSEPSSTICEDTAFD